MKVGIKQISELSGFSIATVSNVLNNKKGVSQQTAGMILQVAKETGYLKEQAVKSIKFVIYKKHGLVVSDTPFFGDLIQGVEWGCRANGYSLEICNISKMSSTFETDMRMLLSDYNSAILLLATEMEEEDIRPFDAAVTPVMLLDNWFDSMRYNATLINNTDSAIHAVSYLIQKGHQKIGYLRGSHRINNFRYRGLGYQLAMQNAALPVDNQHTVTLKPTMDGAYADMLEYLRNSPVLPTAYFADNDIVALGAIKALKEGGYRVPDNISVVGFDDLPFCEISSPTLTTVRVFKREMGILAVSNLVGLIQRTAAVPAKIEISTEFVPRGSVIECSKCEKWLTHDQQ